MKAVMVKGAVVALVAAAVLVPEARAAVEQTSATCRSGSFSGRFTLSYAYEGEYNDPISMRGGLGPYIGDSGTVDIELVHVDAAGTETLVYSHRETGVRAGQSTYSIPDDVKLPSEDTGYATVSFAGGGSSCTAQAEIG
ncbi:hypothetical protein ALI22I_30425 [Saccharothrix sp. ALI-22-I]|uniref:hypothetical protein n=1 Tax=Saccharothrix sp. ALI-22-I TaxID=1933778 RepID=UPI0009CA3625|nr:hypothetical protein [Saccharothrix sp. ALI-22-I]ONI84805.1 hypothetical protein ALI22I_30425 [Saccharothrix sp. ALI-22-I]